MQHNYQQLTNMQKLKDEYSIGSYYGNISVLNNYLHP